MSAEFDTADEHMNFFSVNSNCCVCQYVCACVRVCKWFTFVGTIRQFFCSFHFWQTIKSMKICLIWWQTMMMMTMELLTCHRLSHWWQWCDDVDENVNEKYIERIKKLFNFSSNLHLYLFFLSFKILSSIDIIICGACLYFVFAHFIFVPRKMESSIFFFNYYIFKIWWYDHDEFVLNIYINIYLFLWYSHTIHAW